MSGELHAGMPVRTAGVALKSAEAAMVLVHGRGASASDILFSCEPLLAPGWAFLAPEAAGGTWYPSPFTAPLAQNEPWLSSALDTVAQVTSRAGGRVGLERTVLLGFSQGACLALEYAARNARRYGGVVGLSGGLIGPDGAGRDYPGSLAGTPVLLACGETDPHIPAPRVRESAAILAGLGGAVEVRLEPAMGHEVTEDELRLVRELMGAVLSRPTKEEVSR